MPWRQQPQDLHGNMEFASQHRNRRNRPQAGTRWGLSIFSTLDIQLRLTNSQHIRPHQNSSASD